MKVGRERYQHGSVRKVPRSQGFAWEFRYYSTDSDGKRKLKVQTFDSLKHPTEAAVRKAVEPLLGSLNSDTLAGKLAATLGTIIERYYRDELPSLRHTTQQTNKSLINLHILPAFGAVKLTDITALLIKSWLDKQKFGAASKARARNLISKLLDLAMLWEYIPVARNPMQLVKVKGSTKRQKKLTILTVDQFQDLVASLPEPYNLMVLLSGCQGYRVSETLALQWGDFDFDEFSVTVHRVFSHSAIQELPKTDASGETLPVHPDLLAKLKEHRRKQSPESVWLFPSPRTGYPYSDSTILSKILKPAAAKLGIKGLGWHTFRHSYRTWMSDAGVDITKAKDLMRHADIGTTGNVYGKSIDSEMRKANALVAGQLLKKPSSPLECLQTIP
jgi:integrase